MKKAVLAAAVGLVTTLVAPGAAGARTHTYPESQGYERIDDTFTIPAGQACDGPVIVNFTGYQRLVLNGTVVPVGSDFTLRAGDVLEGTFPQQVITVTNKRDRSQRVSKPTDGPTRERVRRNGVDEDVVATGDNVFFDAGVKGILWTQGEVRFVVKDFDGDLRRLRFKPPTPDRAVELCGRVGLRPVFPRASS